MLPLHGPCGFRIVPVARFTVGDDLGLDIPILNDVWSVDGLVDERTIPIACYRGLRRHRIWEMYTIWFLRPHDRDSPANHGIQLLNATVPITGEFIILRRTIDGERLLDLRRLDNSGMEAALTR